MESIAKTELIDKIVNSEEGKAAGLTKKTTKVTLDLFLEQIKAEVAAGNKIALNNFGSFEAVKVEERQGRNPQTNEAQTIPAHNRVRFSVGKSFKEAVK